MIPKIKIYGPIGGDSDDAITVKTIDAQLEAIGEDVEEIQVLINSDGGSVSQGLGIVNLLNSHPATIHTIVQGSAASIEGFIACCGDKRTIEKDSIFHIHGPLTYTEGNLAEHEQAMELLTTATAAMASKYSELSGKTAEEITEEFKTDKYYTPEQAVALGYMTDIGSMTPIAAFIRSENFTVPESFRASLARRSEPPAKKDKKTMSKNPASLKDLKAKFSGATAEFILEHALAASSIEDASAAYIKSLEAKVKKLAEKVKAIDEEEEVVAMDEEDDEEVVASESMELIKAIKAMIEETEAMDGEEEDDEEVVAMEEEEEVVAMDEEEEDVVANSKELRKLLAGLAKSRKPKVTRSKRRAGAKAVRKSSATAAQSARQSATAQIKSRAEIMAASLGIAQNEAVRKILQKEPKLRERMIAEANNN